MPCWGLSMDPITSTEVNLLHSGTLKGWHFVSGGTGCVGTTLSSWPVSCPPPWSSLTLGAPWQYLVPHVHPKSCLFISKVDSETSLDAVAVLPSPEVHKDMTCSLARLFLPHLSPVSHLTPTPQPLAVSLFISIQFWSCSPSSLTPTSFSFPLSSLTLLPLSQSYPCTNPAQPMAVLVFTKYMVSQ